MQTDYGRAGVDIDAGHEVVRRIASLAKTTFTPDVLSDLGTFGGLFRFDATRFEEPVLVSSADGVGTKIKLAIMAGRHRGIGHDLVNHCVNDILVQGAEPLFFLDYLATGRLVPDVAVELVEGLASACRANGCALLGGETAEMPGFYADGEYDVAGFVVGVVDRRRLVDGRSIEPGDRLVGVPSSGLHTNGYSLARRLVFERAHLTIDSHIEPVGRSVADAFLEPHVSYLNAVRPLLMDGVVEGLAHITGGGITDNLPRVLPPGTQARVDRDAWTVPPLFRWLQEVGDVERDEMYRAFNMGIGLIVVCRAAHLDRVVATLAANGAPGACPIGSIVVGEAGVAYHD